MRKTDRACNSVGLMRLLAVTALSVQLFSGQFVSVSAEPLSSSQEGKNSDKQTSKACRNQAKKDDNWVSGSVVINAPPHVVWEAVHEERQHDPDLAYSKVIPESSNSISQVAQGNASAHEYKLEQKFVLVPILGTAVCQMHNKEVPFERIDYKLIKSDRFKEMQGSWVLSPEEGNKTKLELSSLLDTGMPVPRGMVNTITARKIQKRLKRVKEAAETLNLKVAEHSKHNEPAH